MSREINNFSFWCPVEIFKAAIDEKTGEEIMLLGGIASTADEDSDGEFLDPKGFDIRPLMESGMVNWHHQAKTCPATIVGEPTKAEIRKDGLYIETKLYPSSQVARDIWELAKTLDKDSNTRRLGYSIEGKVLERKSDDKNSPDYKKITKAVITGVAITHQPKNPKTFANIIKGEIDDDLDEEDEENNNDDEKKEKNKEAEKSLDTSEGKPLIREDLDQKLKNVTFGKSQVMERIFNDIPSISIKKAKKVYNLIKNISNMAKRNNITDEDILKAYDALGLKSTDDIQKGNEDNSSEEEELHKSKKGGSSDEDYDGEDDEDMEDSDDEEEDEEDEEEEEDEEDEDERHNVKKANLFDRFDRLEKAIATSHFHNARYIKALGVMVKSTSDELNKAVDIINLANNKIEELTEINKSQEDTINSLSEQLEAFANSTPAPKSIRHAAAVERNFNKAQENEIEKGGNLTIDVNNKAAVLDILDKATFAKGYDNEFSQACTEFEATGQISPTVISRINKEYGISIK